MRGESIQHHTSERVRKDGSRVAVDISLSPIRNERGEVIGGSSIAHDITARRRSEEALRRNEKLATAGRLAAAVAHEINNPLEAVLNLIYLARHHPQNQDQYLEMAEKEVLRVGCHRSTDAGVRPRNLIALSTERRGHSRRCSATLLAPD